MQCNIDARGKLIRLIYGIILILAASAAIALWARGSGSAIRWIVSIALFSAGAFALFESRKGWCAIRALGFKTPI